MLSTFASGEIERTNARRSKKKKTHTQSFTNERMCAKITFAENSTVLSYSYLLCTDVIKAEEKLFL